MLALSGLRIVVTRAAEQAEELAQPLRERGATTILLPTIGIAPSANPQPLAEAIKNISQYDWIVFTSANGVKALGKRDCRARIATVGAATRECAEREGWTVDLTPATYVAEALIEALSGEDLRGRRILIPSAAVRRDVVRDELERRGAVVNVVEAYRNVIPPEAARMAQEVFRAPWPDWITFASSSAVENLLSLVSAEVVRRSKVASIGPITSDSIRRHGLDVTVEPQTHSVPGLVEAMVHAVCPNTA
jgi:uroporphyrinogen III methyltransferase/synthase